MSWGESLEHLARSAEYLAEIANIRAATLQALAGGATIEFVVRTARSEYAAAWRREQERAPSRYLPTTAERTAQNRAAPRTLRAEIRAARERAGWG